MYYTLIYKIKKLKCVRVVVAKNAKDLIGGKGEKNVGKKHLDGGRRVHDNPFNDCFITLYCTSIFNHGDKFITLMRGIKIEPVFNTYRLSY